MSRDDLTLALVAGSFMLGVIPTTLQLERYGADELDSRRGLTLAAATAAAIGVAAALIADSALPLVVAAGVIGLLVYSYQREAAGG